MSNTLTPTQKHTSLDANTAVYQRFNELPGSLKDKMKAELNAAGLWGHFRRFVCVTGNDLGETKIRAGKVMEHYLGITSENLTENQVEPKSFFEFTNEINAMQLGQTLTVGWVNKQA